jgi:hypothetical protein
MLKYAGLSICLCLMALGLNQVFASQTAAQQYAQKSALSVTNGSNTPAKKAKKAGWWKL